MTGLIRAFLLSTFLCLVPLAAQAATPVEGCDPRVMMVMQATAQARVAASKAIDDEIYDQDDSVLALTCFNKAAAVSAQQAGAIFSGDFSEKLAPVITDALTAMYANFDTFSVGGKNNAVDYSSGSQGTAAWVPTTPNVRYDCDQPGSLWSEVNQQGIKGGVPYSTFDDLVKGDVATGPGGQLAGTGGVNFNASWNSQSSQQAFTALRAAIDTNNGYPEPDIPAFDETDTTPCHVMRKSGALAPGTVCPGD